MKNLDRVTIGAAAIAAAVLYTGGSRPYGYSGFGEVAVLVFFGLVATAGTVYVETGRMTSLAWLMGCAMGFLATAILTLNNLRDIDTDRAAGKRTLATRIGRKRTRWLLVGLVCAAYAVSLVAGVVTTLFAMPLAFIAVRTAFTSASPPALVQALKRMAMAELVYALLFALGMLL
jgi:1,4-dihydroxy-2-naphthoate octaprenyltransferase